MGKSPRVRRRGDHVVPFVRARSIGVDRISGDPYVWHSPEYVDGSNFDGADVGLNSYMVDSISDHYEFGERPVMACDHVKVVKPFGSRTVRTYHDWFPFDGFTDWSFIRDGAFWQGAGLYDRDLIAPPPPGRVLRDHGLKAFGEIVQQFPAEISIPNTLLELKEIPKLLDTIGEVDDFLRGLGRKPAGDSIRRVANIHAAESFGVSPLIGDISTAFRLKEIVHARLLHLKRTKGRFVKAGSLSNYRSSDERVITSMEMALDEKIRLVRTSSVYTIHSFAKIRNDLGWVDSTEGWVRALMSTMGFTNPASVLWEATPFSWAVDYLIPIGNYLRTFDPQQVAGWNVKRLCTTVKGVHTINVDIHERNGEWKNLGNFQVQRFTRMVGLPQFTWDISVPSTMQTSLLAAVAIGRNG